VHHIAQPSIFLFLMKAINQVWWYMPVITEFGKLKQESLEVEASLCCIPRACLK
jgi:hypothetical protein